MRHFATISSSEIELAIDLMQNFEIELIRPDLQNVRRVLAWSQRLQRANAYDSFYLALAEERSCDLWTADTRLSNAVNKKWVKLLA